MKKILMSAIVLTAGISSAQTLSLDQLKASAPEGAEIAAPATPSSSPAPRRSPTGAAVLHGWSGPSGREIFNPPYDICTGFFGDDSRFEYCKSDWRKKWASDPSRAAQDYVDEFNRSQASEKLSISYGEQDLKREYPFYSTSVRCEVQVRTFDRFFHRGVSYVVNGRVDVSVYDEGTVETRELGADAETCEAPLETVSPGSVTGRCRKSPTFTKPSRTVEVFVKSSSDGNLTEIGYARPGYYTGEATLDNSHGSVYTGCVIGD